MIAVSKTFLISYIVSAELSYGGRGGPYLAIRTSRRKISISVDSVGEATRLLRDKLHAVYGL